MGITSNFDLEIDTSHPNYTMKLFLLAIALAAVSAEPEAKPYYYGGYGGYGLGYGYGGYGGLYGGYGYGHYLGKRSADSESDPYWVGTGVAYLPYGNGYALGGYGLGYGHLIGK